jgi:anti-anti-sigma factor
MLEPMGDVHGRYRRSMARSSALRRRVSRLQLEVTETTRRIRRVMDSRRPIAGGRGWGPVIDLSVEQGTAATLLHATGDVDLLSIRDIQAALRGMGESGPPLVLSLRDVEYIDCSAVHVLEAECARLEQRGRWFVVIEPTLMLRRIFEVMNPRLPVFPNLDAALNYLEKGEIGHYPNLRAS